MAFRAFDELSIENMKEENGRFIFTIEEIDRDLLSGYVLSYGKHAELLEPETVRQEICETIEDLNRRYLLNQ